MSAKKPKPEVVMHPTTYRYMCKNINRISTKEKIMVCDEDQNITIAGKKIVLDDRVSPTIDEGDWIFPKERFVTYEISDESWCRYFGIGKEATIYDRQDGVIMGASIHFPRNQRKRPGRGVFRGRDGSFQYF